MCGIPFEEQKLSENGTDSGILIVTITIPKRFFLLSVSTFHCFLFPSFCSFSFSFMSSPYTIPCQECRYGLKPCGAHNIVNRNLADNIQCKFLSIISNFFFFFFFCWRYSPLWALACRTIPLHLSLSITNSLHLFTPNT